MNSNVHIHAPPATHVKRRVYHCRQCKCNRVHAVFLYEWYEPSAVCTQCGRSVSSRSQRKRVNAYSRNRAREALGMRPAK